MVKTTFYFIILTKLYLYQSLYSAQTRHASVLYSWYVLAECMIHLFIVLVLTSRVSKPIKFSLRFTNNIVPKLTQRPAFEVRKKNVDLVFSYREVFKRTVRIFTLFPDANLSTDITMFYYHIRLCISLANNCDLFLKTVSIVSLSFHLVIKRSYS